MEDLRRLRPGRGGAAVWASAPDPDPAAALLRTAGAGPPPAGRGPRRSAGDAGRAAPWPQDRTGLQAHPAPPGPQQDPAAAARVVWPGGKGAGDDPRPAPAGVPASGQPEQERSNDPRPAWERIAYAWLEREVDHGQPVDPASSPGRSAWRPRSHVTCCGPARPPPARPGAVRAAGRLVRDQITDAYLTRELPGGGRLDPAELAAEVGTTAAVARQWLPATATPTRRPAPGKPGDRAGQPRPADPGAAAGVAGHLRRRRPPPTRPPPPAGLALERIEQLYQAREVARGQQLDPAEVARQVGVSEHFVRGTLLAPAGRHAHRCRADHPALAALGGRRRPAACGRRCRPRGRGPGGPGAAGPGPLRTAHRHAAEAERAADPWQWSRTTAGRGGWTRPPAATWTRAVLPRVREQVKAAEAKAICAGCQVRDHRLRPGCQGRQARPGSRGTSAARCQRAQPASR